MLDKELLSKIVAEALTKGADFAEIYVEEKNNTNVFCEDNKIDKIFSGKDKGAGIRVIKDGKTAYVYTNDMSEAGLMEATKLARQGISEGVNKGKIDIILNHQKVIQPMLFKRMPEDVNFAEKIAVVLAANKKAREHGEEIKQVSVGVGDLHKKIQIANSAGDYIEDEIARIRLLVSIVAMRDGKIQTGYETAAAISGWELLNEVSFEDLADKAAKRALAMLSARPAPSGRMPVILSSEAGGTMIHEACGHGLEADLVQKELSVFKDKMGQQVAAKGVSVIDDATLNGKYGSYYFDDEGVRAQRTVLIEDGVLKEFLFDRLSASKANRESTGNGRRESYQHKPVVRMSNTFIASGNDDPDEIIASTSSGLFVIKMGGGQVNTTNGDFVFEVQEGYLIENGKIKDAVRGATLSGNGPQVLMDIDRIGNDMGFAVGVCGKEGQGVPVSDAQPTIRIKELVIGGTSIN